MRILNEFYLAIAIIILFLITVPMVSIAYAYVDPGSGILIWQLLAAAFFGVLFYFRKAAARLRDKLKNRKHGK